jgi:heme-degrading monooxygenase HmoA
MSDITKIRYSKHNKVRFKSLEDRDKGRTMFAEFFKSIKKEEFRKYMKGHILLESTGDIQESIILTFWETKEDMDKFYSMQNRGLANLVEEHNPYLKKCLKERIIPCQNCHCSSLASIKNTQRV